MPPSQEACEIPEQAEVRWVHRIRVEMHNVVPNLPYLVEPTDEHISVDSDVELGPVPLVLQEPDVLAKRQIGYVLDVSLGVTGVLCLLQVCHSEGAANQIANVILYIAEKKEWLSKLLELVANVVRCDNPANSLVVGANKNTIVLGDDLDSIKERCVRGDLLMAVHAIANICAAFSRRKSCPQRPPTKQPLHFTIPLHHWQL